MSDEVYVIEVENVSKRYRIGSHEAQQGRSFQRTVFDALVQPFTRMRSLAVNQLPMDAEKEFWALKDVSFTVRQGETFGLIGINGSGKSTMLKIIANIVKPTEGQVTTRGRIGSLLEVSAGFNQELTGRENVFLKGTVQGMSHAEVDERYDAIVDFAELHDFMDTPIKRYSSGMKIRLGFSIAALMDPDIFIVDEAFAVGDMAFREKCLQKIEEIVASGATVLVVSHAMGHITRLCDRVIWLDKGRTVALGGVEKITNDYLEATVRKQEREAREARRREAEARAAEEAAAEEAEQEAIQHKKRLRPEKFGNGFFEIANDPKRPYALRGLYVVDDDDNTVDTVDMADSFRIRVSYEVNEPVVGHMIVFIHHMPSGSRVICAGDTDISPQRRLPRTPGVYTAEMRVPAGLLNEGEYALSVNLGIPRADRYERQERVVEFSVTDEHSERRVWYGNAERPGYVGFDLPWTYLGDEPMDPDAVIEPEADPAQSSAAQSSAAQSSAAQSSAAQSSAAQNGAAQDIVPQASRTEDEPQAR